MIRPGAIGDCILSLPALEQLKTDYIEIWISSPLVPLIQFADCVRSIASTGLDLVLSDDFPAKLREELLAFDEIVSWYGSNRPEFRDALNSFHPQCTFLDALPGADWTGHAADFFLQQVGGRRGVLPHVQVEASGLRGGVVIHPFSGSSRKNWPLTRYREIARRLPVPVEWMAGPEEELTDAWRSHKLLDLAQWIKGAAVYAGNDSGISHLAAAIGVPSVVLFGPTDPMVWAPRGKNVIIIQHQPIDELAIEPVLEAIASYL